MVKHYPWQREFWSHKPLTAGHGRGSKVTEAEKGQIITSYSMNKNVIRLEHAEGMFHYNRWGKDPEARVALEVLKNLISGVGYYTEMDEKHQKPDTIHKNKQAADEYAEDINLDEDLQEITYKMLHKGFCPVEIIESADSERDIKILPSETFYKYTDKKGNLLKYTQERSLGDIISTWEGTDLDSIIMFKFGPDDYGMSLLEPIGDLLDARKQMNVDMPKAVHRWAYPIPIMETSGDKTALQTAAENREPDEWIFIGHADEGDVRWKTLAIDPQARFIPYIELIYYQICEGLHAPLLLYLKNATEASATVMMKSVDRLVNGVQRYIKRRVEKYLFKPQTGEPVPRLVWGQPKTGLEDITLTDLSQIMPYLAKNQQQHILKQYMGSLPEPEWEKQPQLPFQPFQKKQEPAIPVERMIERLNDLQTSLTIIESNFAEGKLGIAEACRLADRTITVHMKRLHGEGWSGYRDDAFKEFVSRKLLKVSKERYTVQVE